jgi:hypothetical protein
MTILKGNGVAFAGTYLPVLKSATGIDYRQYLQTAAGSETKANAICYAGVTSILISTTLYRQAIY